MKVKEKIEKAKSWMSKNAELIVLGGFGVMCTALGACVGDTFGYTRGWKDGEKGGIGLGWFQGYADGLQTFREIAESDQVVNPSEES